MHILVKSTLHTLQNTNVLLTTLSNATLGNTSIAPYHSSIGSHVRHILDFYDCILVEGSTIDLTARKRQLEVETNCDAALRYLKTLQEKLIKLDAKMLNKPVLVTDDLGLGKIEIAYTFSALLAQANSHAIHHYAIINYILHGLQIAVEDSRFGYNPTTPNRVVTAS
jgi:hypothetical protein